MALGRRINWLEEVTRLERWSRALEVVAWTFVNVSREERLFR